MASWLLIRKCKIETAELVWQVLHSDFHQPQGSFLLPFNNHIFLYHHFCYSQCLLLPLSHLDLSHNCCADKLKGTFNCKKWPITSPTQQAQSCAGHFLSTEMSFMIATKEFLSFTRTLTSIQLVIYCIHFIVQLIIHSVSTKPTNWSKVSPLSCTICRNKCLSKRILAFRTK